MIKKIILLTGCILFLFGFQTKVYGYELIRNDETVSIQKSDTTKSGSSLIPFREIFPDSHFDVQYNKETDTLWAKEKDSPTAYGVELKKNRINIKNSYYGCNNISYPLAFKQINNEIYLPVSNRILENAKTTRNYDGDPSSFWVYQDVPYSFTDKDLTALSKYIKQNINSNFELSKYLTSQSTIYSIDEKPIIATIHLNKRFGDFASNIQYEVLVQAGYITKITAYGNHAENFQWREYETLDDKELLALAIKQISLELDRATTKQEISKKYDDTPYYVVSTAVFLDGVFVETYKFEYRPALKEEQ